MARDLYMDNDNDPSSSQVSSEPECVVRYRDPVPSTQIRNIIQQARQNDHDERDSVPSFLDALRASTAPRARRPHDRSHPAYARGPAKAPEDVSPSLNEAKSALTRLMGQTVETISANADRKAARLFRGASVLSTSKSLQGGVSKHTRKHAAPIRREHTSEDVLPVPDVPPAKCRLRSCATDPDISANAGAPMDNVGAPVAGPSRLPPPRPTFFKSRINEPDYEFPSSTPTPPAKQRVQDCSWNLPFSSSSSSSTSLGRSSSSPLVSPGLPRHGRFPRSKSTDPSAWSHERSESSDRQDSPDVSMMDDETSVERGPRADSPEVPPVPYVPPSLPASSMPPPPIPPPRQEPVPPSFHAPSLTPIPASLSRPFVPPSQVPSGSQLERPRASQRHKALGMRPVAYGQSTKFQSKAKPFRVPFAVKRPSESSTSGSGSGSGSGAGSGTVPVERRSMSPVIPDPPYVAARALAQEESGSALEMTARRPEPARMDEDEDEDEGPKDANSSADMWAALDDIDFRDADSACS